ncbi:hypothetical protein [Sulfitobacter litoralis]|uniref:hypothetical protein n=1 Tax=Sulfitobacter litoralis TaxID=335975 RepID=UPI002B27A233|nr:hypothetical protein [Sulfitobacter litoralis]
MSETVTNAEVEDVLSSIRRLVSEDRKPAQKAPEKPSIEDKLVLTPSLRVSNDTPVAAQPKVAPPRVHEVAQQRSASYQEAMQEIDSGEEEEPSASNRNQVAEDFKFISGREPRFRAQFSTPADDHLRDTSEPSRKLAFSAPRAATYSADMLNLGTSELVEDVPPTPDRLSAKIAALETAISRIPENWEPDEPGKSDYSGSEDPAMAWEDDVEFDATGALVSDTLKEPDYDAPQDGSTGWSDTTASSAEPEERIVDSPFAARVTAADAAVEDTTDEPTTAAQHDDAAPFGTDEYLDEEMLRDLVSEIVRSELQGALGERITRNVRKLVRREIHRALTSQDLE